MTMTIPAGGPDNKGEPMGDKAPWTPADLDRLKVMVDREPPRCANCGARVEHEGDYCSVPCGDLDAELWP